MTIEIKQFDLVQLYTTKNIRYLVAPPGHTPNPHGLWSVIGNLGKDLLVCKDGTTCRVPVSDVTPVGPSPADKLLEQINGKAGKDGDSEEKV